MVKIDAEFDGSRVILPADFRARGPGRVTVSFPDDLVERAADGRPSIWDVLRETKPSGRTVDDVNLQIREMRDWTDPRDRT